MHLLREWDPTHVFLTFFSCFRIHHVYLFRPICTDLAYSFLCLHMILLYGRIYLITISVIFTLVHIFLCTLAGTVLWDRLLEVGLLSQRLTTILVCK